MIRAYAALNRGADAIALLSSLTPGSLPPGRREVLRAQALVAMDRGPDAKSLLIDVLKEHPDLMEAHRLLGAIYEHEGDWQHAAQEYRAGADGGAR